MTFINKLNYKESGNLITDELFTLDSTKVYELNHDNLINNASLQVWTEVGKTGTQVTDFTISQKSEKPWEYILTFGNLVSLGDYYVTYYSQGDRNDADDINAIQNELISFRGNNSLKLSDFQYPITVCHRGGSNVFPESSLEAYRSLKILNHPILEMDVHITADGALACIHDTTMDATTNKTGEVAKYSVMGFKSAKINTLAGWEGTPVLFEELIAEFGNSVIYAPEIKDYKTETARLLTDKIIEHGLEDNVIIQSFSQPSLQYPHSKGLEICYLRADETTAVSTIIGYGFSSVGLPMSVPDSYITDCINAGLKVYMYTVNRRYQVEHYNTLGVHGYFSDDPLWIDNTSVTLSNDPFSEQMFSHGMLAPDTGATGYDRGGFTSPNKYGWASQSTNSDFCLQGWAGYLPNTFTLTTDITFESLAGSTRWGAVALCTPKDFWDDSNELSSGYHLLLRESGVLDFYTRTGTTVSKIGTLATTGAFAEGSTYNFQIQVTDTQIIVTRIDTGEILTIDDTGYRGGYLHLGRRYSGVTFSNISIV
jgi:glycerophosphoryl diester phosphodiesterase